jgi:hypothetical protein
VKEAGVGTRKSDIQGEIQLNTESHGERSGTGRNGPNGQSWRGCRSQRASGFDDDLYCRRIVCVSVSGCYIYPYEFRERANANAGESKVRC